MASPKLALLLVLAAVALVHSASAADDSCRDMLGGLEACHGFMFEGAPAASPACCDAYGAVFNTDPFCLCYIANGVYGQSTGYDVNVTHALEIPTSCGQVQPPIELCGMPDLQLPPYDPASSTEASSPSPAPASAASVEPPRPSPASRANTDLPPPPPPTSLGGRDSSVEMAVMFFAVAAGMFAAVA
ncbi:non-specific lipid transfer protein GPI-anchored 19-like [Lolium rigidum]|uniref:non-specific lipid transfer protein GPI-anchored 19-like n=1 Tax=Lolium rigidum TaxID=89674 RepID=UPI001F5D3B41|nr:non-specific lipid transfer protein GPI-anchored 19-like [Lolium rigidum]